MEQTVRIPLIVKSKSDFADKIKSDLAIEEESIDGYEATIAIANDKYKAVLTEILNDEKDHAKKLKKILEGI